MARPGDRRGIPDPVDWSRYSRAETERHAREIHYDVLRQSGFDADRAREIAHESADGQARQLDKQRDDAQRSRGVAVAASRPTPPDWRRHVPACVFEGLDEPAPVDAEDGG
jgi:hypothetical protein